MQRRLRPLDWVLLVALTGAWLLLSAEVLREGVRNGDARLLVAVDSADSPRSYPTIRGSPLPGWNPGLEPDDEILAVAGEDLAGRTAMYFYERGRNVALERGSAPIQLRRLGVPFETRIAITPTQVWWQYLVISSGLMISSLLLFVRAPGWHLARRYFVAVWCICASLALAPNILPPRSVLEGALTCLVFPLGVTLMVLVAQEFTLSARPVPWLHRAIAASVFLSWLALFLTLSFIPNWGIDIFVLGPIAGIWLAIAILIGVARAYRRSEPLERRQIRWVLLGGSIVAVAEVLNAVAFRFGAPAELITAITSITRIGIPLGILVSVIGYGWLDVDRLISATASYTVLGLAVLGAALALIPQLAHAAAPAVGLDPAAGQWALTMGLVGAAIPVHRFLRPRIDRRLFAARHERMLGFERLLDEIGRCTTVEELTRLAGERMDALLEPESIATYGREEGAFTPLFVRGRTVPPAFEADSLLVRALEQRTRPLATHAAALDPFERAALETLGVAVIVPTRRGDALVAFTCLGAKRSGDIYTPEELAYLAAVANRCAEVLVKLDAEVVLHEARELQHALRRYVPGVVAEEIAGGRDLASGEREVSVLFVDLRGYTSFAERNAAEDVFSTLNAYTEKVSRIVAEHGGSVVEFHGDGLLAVFGAPRVLERKERAAVEAAREVLDALAGDLSVGIGIATGKDVVGNIRGADRMIWTVVGNTTNLASRLQSLTRELDAAIAIDEATHDAAGYVCADFEKHENVRIRGRSEPRSIWVLPLGSRGT